MGVVVIDCCWVVGWWIECCVVGWLVCDLVLLFVFCGDVVLVDCVGVVVEMGVLVGCEVVYWRCGSEMVM